MRELLSKGTMVITAMNASVQQAELRTACTLFTVKNRTITCGNPAVPHIRAAVMQNMFTIDNFPVVYS